MSNQEEPPNATTWDGMEAQETDSLLLQSKNDENNNDHHHTGLLATITEGVVLGVEAIGETTGEIVEGMTEMAGDVAENFQEAAHEMQEAVVEEVHHVQEGFMEELHEADEGDVFFLEMSLTRNLSILPGDKNLTEAVTEAQDALHLPVTISMSETTEEEAGEISKREEEVEPRHQARTRTHNHSSQRISHSLQCRYCALVHWSVSQSPKGSGAQHEDILAYDWHGHVFVSHGHSRTNIRWCATLVLCSVVYILVGSRVVCSHVQCLCRGP